MFVECDGHSYRIRGQDSHLTAPGIELYGGSSWHLLHREYISFVIGCLTSGSASFAQAGVGNDGGARDDMNSSQRRSSQQRGGKSEQQQGAQQDNPGAADECALVRQLLDYAQYKLSFEELFFQTISRMSTWCWLYKNRDLRHVDWSKSSKQQEQLGCLHLEEVHALPCITPLFCKSTYMCYLCVCLCVCVCVCVYTYIYTYLLTCTRTPARTHARTHAYT